MNRKALVAVLLTGLLYLACAPVTDDDAVAPTVPRIAKLAAGAERIPGEPSASFVEVATDVELEVLEWSSDGLPLVLLAGAGHSAHVYRDFAPHFTDRFRVIGITRRRIGRSDAPEEPFGIADLASDIIAVLDAYSIDSAFFMGHSFGGAEMSHIALHYPERARKLVYLDGSWDFQRVYYSEGWWDPWPDVPMDEDDKASPQAVSGYFARTMHFVFPLEEIMSIHSFDSEGRLVALNPNVGRMFRDMIAPSLQPLDYSRFNTPVLAVRAIPETVEGFFGGYSSYDQENQRLAREAFSRWINVIIPEGRRFLDEVPGARELRIAGASHEVLQLHAGEFLAPVRAFLEEG